MEHGTDEHEVRLRILVSTSSERDDQHGLGKSERRQARLQDGAHGKGYLLQTNFDLFNSNKFSGLYGKSLYIWDYKTRTITQTIELAGEGSWMPFEVRFLHEPTEPHAYVGTAYGSAIYHLYKDGESDAEWKVKWG